MNNHYGEIVALSQKLSDPQQTKNDMQDAMALVAGMLRERYLGRMNESFTKIRESSQQNPPKEVALLKSLKPFIPETTHARIDKLSELILIIDTITKLRTAQATPEHGVFHEDGVYEVDWDCMRKSRSKE